MGVLQVGSGLAVKIEYFVPVKSDVFNAPMPEVAKDNGANAYLPGDFCFIL